MLASGSVWGWNHVVASESTALRKALRVAQIEEYTATEEAYHDFLASQDQGENALQFPDRETYREQAKAQVDWMLSGGVTLVLALLTYLFASVLLGWWPQSCCITFGAFPRCRNVPSSSMRRHLKTLLWLFALTLLGQHVAQAQRGRMNLPNFDARPYHFGFILSGNQRLQICGCGQPELEVQRSFKPASRWLQHAFDGLVHLDSTPQGSVCARSQLQERALLYRFSGSTEQLERTSAVNLDVPLLIKWRTDRMTNVAAYALGGVKYLRDFQSQEDVRQEEDILRLRSGNVALDLGAGIDIFLPFFKLAIQAKTEHGLLNVLLPGQGELTSPLEFLRTRSFVLSVCFEG